MELGLLGREHLHWCPPGHPMDPGVAHLAERLAGVLELGERVVLLEQVRVGRDQIGLRESQD